MGRCEVRWVASCGCCGGWDGVSKVSFNDLHTLWVYRTSIYLLIYTLKNCHEHSYGFQNLMSSWGWGNTIFEITLRSGFSNIWFQTCHFFGFYFSRFFFDNPKNIFAMENLKKFGCKLVTLFCCL